MTTIRRCPDCGVELERMKLRTTGGYELELVTNERKSGILGNLGMKETLEPAAFVCPECGLVREYVDVER
jgi:predicted RNA-binding Zn-ribbon protein involved in translation (DUF1610 family)